MLQLQPLAKEYEESGLRIITVTGDRDEKIIQFWEDNNLTLKVLADDNNALRKFYSVQLYPTGFILDREGNVVYHTEGWSAETLGEWKQKVEEYL